MIESLNALLATILSYVWSTPLVVLLVGTGLLLTFALGCPQIKGFWHAIKVIMGRYDDPKALGETSHFQALCTALSATVGLGNIAGVAVAINLGGPGAVFWMMLTGLVGMSTKFTECSLAVMYRDIDKNGTVYGGPMYYITKGLGENGNLWPFSLPLPVCVEPLVLEICFSPTKWPLFLALKTLISPRRSQESPLPFSRPLSSLEVFKELDL